MLTRNLTPLASIVALALLFGCDSSRDPDSTAATGETRQPATAAAITPFTLNVEFEGLIAWVDTTRTVNGAAQPVTYALLPNAAFDFKSYSNTGYPAFLGVNRRADYPQHYPVLRIPSYLSGGVRMPEQMIPLRGVDVSLEFASGSPSDLDLASQQYVDLKAISDAGKLDAAYAEVSADFRATVPPAKAAPNGELAARITLDRGTLSTKLTPDKFGWGYETSCPTPEDQREEYVATTTVTFTGTASVKIHLTSIADSTVVSTIALAPPDAGPLTLYVWNKTPSGFWHFDLLKKDDSHYHSFRWFYALATTKPTSLPNYPCEDAQGGDRCPQTLMWAP